MSDLYVKGFEAIFRDSEFYKAFSGRVSEMKADNYQTFYEMLCVRFCLRHESGDIKQAFENVTGRRL